MPLERPRSNKSAVSMLFSHFFRPSHKLLSLACTSVHPHAFPYFGTLECDVPFHTCSNTSVRLLGAVERQLVMNLLWLESSIPTATMSSWVTKEGKTWGSYPLFHLVTCNYALSGISMMLSTYSHDYTFCQIMSLPNLG